MGAAIKKLLKILIFIFSIYFYYSNNLKKHINMASVHKTKKEEGKKHKTKNKTQKK